MKIWGSAFFLLLITSECSAETVKLGDAKTLQCKLKKANRNCQWIFPDKIVLDKLEPTELAERGVTLKEGSCDLTIPKVEVKHDGTWKCKNGEILELTVLMKPDGPFLEWENGARIVDDVNEIGKQSSINLTCTSINGNPKPESMTWTVNDKVVNSTDGMRTSLDTEQPCNASIHLVLDLGKTTHSLDNAEKERKVICTVKHVSGEQKVQHIFRNTYDSLPNETTNGSVTAVDGSAVIIPCPGSASRIHPVTPSSDGITTPWSSNHPDDKIDNACFWLHGESTAIFSRRLSDSPGYQILSDNDNKLEQCDLVIYKVNREHHGDWYCTRGNNHRQKVQLTVTDRISGHQPDVSAVEGSSVVLPCRLRNPNQLCYWTHGNDAVVNKSNQNSKDRIRVISAADEGNCDLLIQNIQEQDGGNWHCHIFGNGPKKVVLGIIPL